MAQIDRGLEPAQYSPSHDLENLKRKLKGDEYDKTEDHI